MQLNTEQSQRFHMLAGTFLTGKNYFEYLEQFVDLIPTHDHQGNPIKGNKSLKAFTDDCRVKTKKHLEMLKNYININQDSLRLTIKEADRLEDIISLMITLSPTGQTRVKNLIDKIKKDQAEIEYWKEFEEEQ